MAEPYGVRVAKSLVGLVGANPRLYVPGTLRVLGGRTITWTERCSARCKHDNECHVARTALIPTGTIDGDEAVRDA